MTNVIEIAEARRRMNLRKVLWFRCMDKATILLDDPNANIAGYDKALRVIAEAYGVSCEEVRTLEGYGISRPT